MVGGDGIVVAAIDELVVEPDLGAVVARTVVDGEEGAVVGAVEALGEVVVDPDEAPQAASASRPATARIARRAIGPDHRTGVKQCGNRPGTQR